MKNGYHSLTGIRLLLLIGMVLIHFSCAQPQPDISSQKIYIIRHGWHTGIIFDRNEALPYLTKLDSEFPEAAFMEISWGDKDFFTAEKGTVGLALKAALVPTKAVLLIQAYDKNPYRYFNPVNIREIDIAPDHFKNLIGYFNTSIAIDTLTKMPIEVLRYGSKSCFFLSTEKYHAFKTCNVWTARALKKADKKVFAAVALTSGSVMRKAGRAARRAHISKD